MNPFNWLKRHSPLKENAEKLYGAIVAQARLPGFYADLGVPDTMEGRLSMLTLHNFAVLRRLREEGSRDGDSAVEARELAQELVDIFSADMDTVLREMGVSDMKVPKKVRDICAKTHGVINVLQESYDHGEDRFRESLAALMPMPGEAAEAASRTLSTYLQRTAATLAEQPLAALRRGEVQFPEVPNVEES
jgi:cytochrome b pre-mRNA-processing protein 3